MTCTAVVVAMAVAALLVWSPFMRQVLLTVALLYALIVYALVSAASAAGIDYICGDYSIVVEPKNRTYQSYSEGITSTVAVSKGITIFGASGEPRMVKTLPRNKSGRVAVHGIPCRKVTP